MRKTAFFAALVMVALCLFSETRLSASDVGHVVIALGGAQLRVEVARTVEEKMRGLMGRDSLPKDAGMIFLYTEDCIPRFWMKDTLIPLSIAFIRSDGVIVSIYDLVPLSRKEISPPVPVRYAIEVNRGWFEKNGVRPGDKVRLPREIP